MLVSSATVSPQTDPGRTPHAPMHHRADIDGLRSFAILPILLLHCGVTGLRGGFVGVDIFFVISGYLITAIVEREIAAGVFSLTGFYRRRIVRILPALIAMMAIVLTLGCAILFPVTLRDLGRSVAATAAFGSNIYLYATGDYYFAKASDMKPMVHTWSLAVEEQFYVLYPLLLLAMRRLERGAIVGALIAVATVSLSIGAYLAITDPVANFYLLPSRIWELLAGGLVAMGAYPRLDNRAWREVVCWLALGAIMASIVVVKATWPFPVPLATPCVLGAALLIAYAPGTRVALLLSWTPLRWVGMISYSLYLWHRPIIAYYLLGRSVVMTPRDTVILLALSFAAALLSYTLVERPALRRWRTGKGLAPHAWALMGLSAIAATGLIVAARAEHVRTLPPAVARVVSYLGFDQTPAGVAQYRTGTCFGLPFGKPYNPSCLVADRHRANVLLAGDSYAAQLSQTLRGAIAPAHLMQATAAGCRPVIHFNGEQRCQDLSRLSLQETDLSHVSAVVLAGRWFDVDVVPLAGTIRSLRARGVRVVVVGPSIEYDADMPDLLGRAMLAGDLTRLPKALVADRPGLDRKIGMAARQAGAAYVSHYPIECPGGPCRLVTPDGAPIHVDHAHLSPEAAIPVTNAVIQALGPLQRR